MTDPGKGGWETRDTGNHKENRENATHQLKRGKTKKNKMMSALNYTLTEN